MLLGILFILVVFCWKAWPTILALIMTFAEDDSKHDNDDDDNTILLAKDQGLL